MPQLDQFIGHLIKKRADTLEVASGQPLVLMSGGQRSPLTTKTLNPGHVLTLGRELLGDQIGEGAQLPERFEYDSPSGPVEVHLASSEAGPVVTIRPAGTVARNGLASPSPAVAAEVAPDRDRAADPTPSSDARAHIDQLLTLLVQNGGSDLHLRVGQPPIIRKDGALVRQKAPAMGADELGAMHRSIMPPKDRGRFDETGDADYAYEIDGVARFRCNAAMDRGGPMGVFRVVPSDIPSCEQMMISPAVQKLCYLNKGLVLVTGPTGSGKSTTLAAMVDLMNREREDHILTIEDPIEFVHESKKCLVTHRQVGLHTESFKSGLRAALREDPDIVLIGELRDLETVAIAIETAETGHLVFGTLHTTTAPSTVDRIIDQFPADRQSQIRVMLSESLRGVVSQTLCKKKGGGRVAAREILLTSPAVSNLIREGKTFQLPSVIQTGRKIGMISLNDALLELVEQGLVEPSEAYLKAVDKMGIEQALKSRGHKVAAAAEA